MMVLCSEGMHSAAELDYISFVNKKSQAFFAISASLQMTEIL
jgi:hypothetical protein